MLISMMKNLNLILKKLIPKNLTKLNRQLKKIIIIQKKADNHHNNKVNKIKFILFNY